MILNEVIAMENNGHVKIALSDRIKKCYTLHYMHLAIISFFFL